ncbi:hypothetical protein Tco_0728971 [Tanacetum coccineum]|uniref:Uncharacterized protein n=1 Tax=Tanacetum coccineum TaxID=301880 RepID=A0ABQ4YQ09_9ASTR
MDFRSFMMQEIDGEFKFLSEGSIDDNQGSPSSKSVNNEAPVIDAKPLTSLYPPDFVQDVVDSDDASAGDNMNPLLGTSPPPLPEAGVHLLLLNDLLPFFIEFPSAKELKNSADCHWVVAHVTPPFWKEHLRQISIKQICDIHDRAYMRQVILDNEMNSRTQELISTLHKATTLYDVIQARELEKDRAYAELERKCNKALLDLDKNPLVADMRTEIETLKRERLKLSEIQLLQEMDALKHDKSRSLQRGPDCLLQTYIVMTWVLLVAAAVKDSLSISSRSDNFQESTTQIGDDLANGAVFSLSKYVNGPLCLAAVRTNCCPKKPESFAIKAFTCEANDFSFASLKLGACTRDIFEANTF